MQRPALKIVGDIALLETGLKNGGKTDENIQQTVSVISAGWIVEQERQKKAPKF